MTVHSPLRFARRAFVGSGFAWALSAVAVEAQRAAPDADRPPVSKRGAGGSGSGTLGGDALENLVQSALAEPDTTPLSRPAILGLGSEKLTTKSIERNEPNGKYGFMVIIPRRDDGLIFFRGADKPLFFAIHRTGTRLNRIASAINRNGSLEKWSGSEADADFAKQLSFWGTKA
jgi:hypothetical protein